MAPPLPYNPFPPPPPVFTSSYPINTAQAVGNLYTQPLGVPAGLGPLMPSVQGRLPALGAPTPMNTAASVQNLYSPINQLEGRFPAAYGGYVNPQPSSLPYIQQPASYVDDALRAQVAEGSRIASSIPTTGELATAAPAAAAEAVAGRGLLGNLARSGGRYAVARGILGGIAGNTLANLVPGEGFLSQALQGGLRGAGYGAAFGTPGMLIGGGIGAAADALNIPILQDFLGGGEEQPKPPDFDTTYRDTLARVNSAFDAMGISSDRRQEFFSGLNARLALVGDDEEARQGLLASIIPAATNVLDTAEAEAPTQLNPQDIATIQAMVGSFTQPYAQQYVNSSNQLAGILNETASTLPPAYRQAVQAQAAQQVANANQYAAALQQQAAVLPAFSAYQMAISQAYQQPRSAGGGQDLASILASIAPAA